MRALASLLLLLLTAPAAAGRLSRLPDAPGKHAAEFEIDKQETVRAFPTPESGMVVLRERRNGPWQVTWLDEQLDPHEAWDLPVSAGATFEGHGDGEAGPVLVFRDKHQLYVVQVPTDHSEPQTHAQVAPTRVRWVNEVEVAGDHVYVYTRRGRHPTVLASPLDDPFLVAVRLPRTLGRKPNLHTLAPSLAGTGSDADVTLTPRREKRPDLTVVGLRGPAVVEVERIPQPPGERTLLTAQRARLMDGSIIRVGTFARSWGASGAMGVYAQHPGHDPTYVSFADMPDFFAYRSQRGQQRLEDKQERLRSEGRELALNMPVLLHDVVEQDGRLLLVGEVFQVETRTETRTRVRTVSGPNGTTRTTTETYTVQVFDGYRVLEGFVVALGPDGAVVGTSTFEMGDVKSMTLRPRLRLQTLGNTLIMRYAFGSRVHRKVLRSGELLDKETRRIRAPGGAERVKDAWSTDTGWWHDDVFAVWGIQRRKGPDGKRTVFFVRALDEGDEGDDEDPAR